MAELADLDTSREDDDGVGYQEMDEGEAGRKQSPETASQLGTEEADGKATKKKKKAAQRIIQDGECIGIIIGNHTPMRFQVFWRQPFSVSEVMTMVLWSLPCCFDGGKTCLVSVFPIVALCLS